MQRARTKRLPELFAPTWVVVPFAASTAAAGLYLVWVHRGQKEEAKEPLNDLDRSALAKKQLASPDAAMEKCRQDEANAFYDENFTDLNIFWRDEVQRLFITGVNRYAGARYNSKTYALNDKLAERFSQFFKRETTTWRDLKQARTEITQTLRNILETV